MARVTDMARSEAVLVAHGFPSDPEPQDLAMKVLAHKVAALSPGWLVRGATLARDGSLAQAMDGLAEPLVYPFFMAEGYFTTQLLPARLVPWKGRHRQLPPFGTDPALPALVMRSATDAIASAGQNPRQAGLLLAAHGSRLSAASKDSALTMLRHLEEQRSFAEVRVGFIEEEPFLADAARNLTSAACLPFFALRAGHVDHDIPDALAQADFDGLLLPAIGEHDAVPGLVAAALRRAGNRIAA